MADIAAVVDDYIAAWNERDPENRRTLLERAFTEEATYVDPARDGSTHGGIDTMIGAAQEHFPGHRIELSFGPDAHKDRVRFAWKLLGPDDAIVFGGTDFAIVADDGRLAAVTGFSDPAS